LGDITLFSSTNCHITPKLMYFLISNFFLKITLKIEIIETYPHLVVSLKRHLVFYGLSLSIFFVLCICYNSKVSILKLIYYNIQNKFIRQVFRVFLSCANQSEFLNIVISSDNSIQFTFERKNKFHSGAT